jgi:peptide/nickel transport system ATP-binding protein
MSLLAVDNLAMSIGETPILRNVNVGVDEGEVLGLIGESGSGKTMTALSVMQLLPQSARATGSVSLAGNELMGLDEARLCAIRGNDIGMVFQEPMTALNPVKTIGDQVAEAVLVHAGASRRDARDIARATLNRVGLPVAEFPLERFPHELSGGQRQRVVIAMAIALRPRVLIADEPTTALDVTTQAQILDLLRKLVDEDGVGLMLITHDLAVVAGIAHRIAIMRDGEVVETGKTEALLGTKHHPYTEALLAASAHVPHRHRPPIPEPGQAPVVAVEGVVREYPLPRQAPFAPRRSFRAVDEVSFVVHRGENVGLVGESGCGKSTLSRAILALDPMQAGSIVLDGEPLTGQRGASRSARRKMQVVFQDPFGSFNPRHKVERLVAEPFHLLADPPTGAARRRHVEAALEDVGLKASDADKFIHEFSGGQRQRVAIARALIIRPALIVLDEAVSALDVSIRAQILDLLADLSNRLHVSYLFIAHDLTVVRAITDRVLVMRAGRIVEEGATEEVFKNPQHPYTKELIAAAPDLARAMAARRQEGHG